MTLPTIAGALLLTVASAAAPATPAPALELLAVRSFTVEQPFVFSWRAERPAVREGTMIAIRVDPGLVRPRQTAEPVLYVGDHTAWRVSAHEENGVVIAFVPARVDLNRAPVWFGSPALPERVDAATIAHERELALQAGIRPFGESEVEAAVARGGGEAALASRTELLRALHGWLLELSGS